MNSNFKRKLSVFAAMLTLVSITGTAMALDGGSNILGQTSNVKINETNGQITKMTFKDNITIKDGQVGQVDLKTFNLSKNQKLDYGFNGKYQTMINRVLGGRESQIFGKITNSGIGKDTGKVILINPAGVMFGQGSSVNLNDFTVSTHDFVGAKNLKEMSSDEIKEYTKDLYFDYGMMGEELEFKTDKLSAAKVTFEGAKFNIDNNLSVFGNKVNYINSMIKAGNNVKFVTADGKNFGIYALNNGLEQGAAAIEAKDVNITGGSVGIKDTFIKADTATYNSNGEIIIGNSDLLTKGRLSIESPKEVKIDNSKLTSSSDWVIVKSKDNANVTSSKIYSDEKTFISADNVNVKGSEINAKDVGIKAAKTADVDGSKLTSTGKNNEVYIEANDVNVKGKSELNSQGRVFVNATSGNATINNSSLTSSAGVVKVLSEKSDVNINKSALTSKKDILVISGKNLDVKSSNLSSNANTVVETGKNTTFKDTNIKAAGNVDIKGVNDTTVDASTIKAKNINIYTSYDDSKLQSVAKIDNKSVLTADKNIRVSNINGTLEVNNSKITANQADLIASDDLTVSGSTVTGKGTNAIVSLTSTDKDVNVTTNSTLSATGADSLVAVSAVKKASVSDSNINAQGKISLDTFSEDVTINNSALTSSADMVQIKSGKDTNINKSTLKSEKSISMSTKANTNITSSELTSNKNLGISSGKNATVKNSTVKSAGFINLKSNNATTVNSSTLKAKEIDVHASKDGKTAGYVLISNKSTLTADKTINLGSVNGSTTIKNSNVTGNKVDVVTSKSAIVTDSKISAAGEGGQLNIEAKDISLNEKASLNAQEKLFVNASNNTVIDNATLTSKKNLTVSSANKTKVASSNLTSNKNLSANGTKGLEIDKSNINANGEVIIKSANANVTAKNSNVKAGTNVTVSTQNGSFVNAKNNFEYGGKLIIK